MSDWKDWDTPDYYVEIKKSEYDRRLVFRFFIGLGLGLSLGWLLDVLVNWSI